MTRSRHVLPLVVLSQFFCTSIWFAGNTVIGDLIKHADPITIGLATSAVQFGFIAGTLLFAFFAISDRFSPSSVFFISAILGGICNFSLLYIGSSIDAMLLLRLLSGFFLAGIYPIGMKIIADHYKDGLGSSLGFLVGALVLGTALPHLLKQITSDLPWQAILYTTSIMAATGGVLVGLLVPDGPFRIKSKFDPQAIPIIFKSRAFRSVAIGYFGHCWELYAFWAFVPQILLAYSNTHKEQHVNIPMICFVIIASGSIACIISGLLSRKFSPKRFATLFLFLSGACCLFSPLLFHLGSNLLIIVLTFWGMVVVADSPLFSALMAQKAPPHLKGTALTIANCVGFFITVVSIQLTGNLIEIIGTTYAFMFLAIGPIIGIISLLSKKEDYLE